MLLLLFLQPWEGAAAAVSSNGPPGTPGAAYSSNVVPDGPSGFGVRGYGGAPATTAAAMTPTSGRFGASSSTNIEPAAAEGGGDGREGPASGSSSRFDVPADKPAAVGYDLSQLLGADAARDAPWRPPPPPAATVQRPAPTSTTLTAADSAPAAAAAGTEPEPDMQAAGLMSSAASAPAMTTGLDAAAAGAAVPDAAGGGPAADGVGGSGGVAGVGAAAAVAARPAVAAVE